MLSIVDGTFAALTVLPFALVFFLAYGNRASKNLASEPGPHDAAAPPVLISATNRAPS